MWGEDCFCRKGDSAVEIKRRRKRCWSVGLLALAVMLLVIALGTVFQVRRQETWGYTCRICGATRDKTVTYLFGLPVWLKRTGVHPQSGTNIYQELIGEPHEHEWAGDGHSVDYGNIWGAARHSDGSHKVAPYPIFQYLLTNTALEVVAILSESEPEFRKRVYREILKCTNPGAYANVLETFDRGAGADAQEVWREWLAMRSRK
jgi:hypothetical protein